MEQFDANFRPRDETLNEVKILPELLVEAVFLAWDVRTVSTRRCLFFSQGQDESLRQVAFLKEKNTWVSSVLEGSSTESARAALPRKMKTP